MSIRCRGVAGLVGLTLFVAACQRPAVDGPDHVEEPVRPRWHALALPMPAGPTGRLVLGDTAACAGRWYIAGGGAWWTPVPLADA